MNYIQRLKKYLEQIIYKNRYNWDDVEVYFIIGTGRTATNFFAKFIQENYGNKVLAVHEPMPDLSNYGISKLRGEISQKDFLNYIRFNRALQCKNIHNANGNKIYIESNNNVTISIEEIRMVFPKVKFVHITRNPQTYIGSSLNKINKGKTQYTLYGATDYRPRITAKDFENDTYSKSWDHFTQFNKLCWYWNKINEIYLDYDKSNNDIITVKYEDIFFDENNAGLFKVLNFMGLDTNRSFDKFPINSKVNVSTGQQNFDYTNWSEEEKIFFKETVSKTAQKLNYKL